LALKTPIFGPIFEALFDQFLGVLRTLLETFEDWKKVFKGLTTWSIKNKKVCNTKNNFIKTFRTHGKRLEEQQRKK